MGGDAEKKIRQNEWQVNGDKCCEMIRIKHGARETPEVLQNYPSATGLFFKETWTPPPSIKWF